MSAKSAGLATKNPFAITIPEWLAMADEVQEAAREEAGRLGQTAIVHRFAEGHIYVMLCATTAFAPLARYYLDKIENVDEVADYAVIQRRVPFEFFGLDVPTEFIQERRRALNAALALKAAEPEEPAEE